MQNQLRLSPRNYQVALAELNAIVGGIPEDQK
jgi:hypothetical protein